MRFQKRHLLRQALGIGHIIGIHAREVASAREIDRLIEARRQTNLPAIDMNLNTIVGERSHQFDAAIGRAIVQHDELPVDEALRKQRTDCRLDRRRGIVHGQRDAHQRRGHGSHQLSR
jgi:hypothetical protein